MSTVLIIEDYDSIRELLETLLEWIGIEVITAVDGNEGLRLALSHQPDLILLDLGLPGMDGFEVLAKLRQDNSQVRVVVMSATTVPKVPEGAIGFLSKPFDDLATLEQTILQYLP